MGLRNLSFIAQVQGAVDLRNPAKTFAEFSNKIARTFGKTVNNPKNPSEFGTPTMFEAFSKRGDPLLNIDWIGIIVDKSNPKAIEWSYIQAIQTPSLQVESKPVFRAGKMSHYAGIVSVENINISLYTDTTGKALKLASSWIDLIYNNRTGDYRLPKEYKKEVFVYFLDPAQKTVCVMKFFGCFPVSWNSYSLDGNQSSMLVTTLDLAVDSFSIGAGERVADQVASLATFS
jgi:T4-like virus tail tube protein gp19